MGWGCNRGGPFGAAASSLCTLPYFRFFAATFLTATGLASISTTSAAAIFAFIHSIDFFAAIFVAYDSLDFAIGSPFFFDLIDQKN